MAIENTYLLGKNITLGCGFDLQAKAPLDSRQTVPAFAGLQALIDNNAAYEGMIVYDEETKKTYQAQMVDDVLKFREFGINEAELKDLIASETTAAMEFKGAATALPENPAKGDMYKVTTAFKIGEEDAKVGDSIVYDGEQWFIIPSGDDIEDTWRPVTGVDNDASLTFAAGDKLEKTVAADGTITYKHAAIDAPANMNAEGDEQTRTYITRLITDNHGHVIGFKTATENVEDTNTTYEFEGLPVGEDEGAPSSVYFQVKSSEDGATAEVIYIDAYTRNEADGKFVEKVEGKQLSTEDFTTALLNKLNGIAEEANKYEHATHAAYAEGFYKVTVDAEGHVSNATAVTKEDIVALGIPGQDTTYEKATVDADGLMSKEHFAKVEGIAEGATKVENVGGGKIKIDGEEVTVYAHPDKHIIDDVTGLQDALNGKVDVVTGKGLSTNDLTTALKGQYDEAYAHSQVDHAPDNAQENVIESVKVNGTALTITNKVVDITVPTGALADKDEVAKDDLADALKTEIEGKVGSIAAGDESVTIGGTATAPTVAVKISAAEGNAITLEDDGIKVIIPESTKVEASTTNGNIKVDGEEVTVYTHPDKHTIADVTGLQDALNNLQAKGDYAAEEHDHTASEITDFAIEVAKVKVTDATHADAATKVDNALTVTVGGEDVVFDGSAAKTVDVDAAIEAAINEIPEQTDYTVTITETTTGLANDIAKKYTFTQNGTEIGTINLAKDLVVTSGSVREVTVVDAPYTGAKVGDKYIELVIANQNNPIYVPAKDLVDIYTAKELTVESADEVKIAISNTNEISATLVDGKIAKSKLNESVQASLAKADSALQSHQDISHLATIEGVDAKFANYTDTVNMNSALALKADKTELETAIANVKIEASNQDAVVLAEAQKYTNALVDNVYTKGQTYTKEEVDALLTWGEF